MKGDWFDTFAARSNFTFRMKTSDFDDTHIVVHCHNILHEDEGMMTYMQILPKNQGCNDTNHTVNTNYPTTNPTDRPTRRPSNRPTMRPTETPTDNPTDKPTNSPTDKPSNNPTMRPTENPSDIPSDSPSSRPTVSPSDKSTLNPSTYPSATPTGRPTASPSSFPIVTTTDDPTNSPVGEPLGSSVVPSSMPSDEPTGEPTLGYTEGLCCHAYYTPRYERRCNLLTSLSSCLSLLNIRRCFWDDENFDCGTPAPTISCENPYCTADGARKAAFCSSIAEYADCLYADCDWACSD